MSAMDSPQAVPQITIVNEKGRSSQAEDVRMIQKAEEFCAEASPTRPRPRPVRLKETIASFCAHSEQGKDVALLTIGNGIFEAKATASGTHPGNEDVATASSTSARTSPSARSRCGGQGLQTLQQGAGESVMQRVEAEDALRLGNIA